MRVLITRPREDAERLALRLALMGHEPLIVPLLETRFRDGDAIALDGVQAILATSANGVRAFARRSVRRDVPLFAVGPQTAQAARAAGFATVRDAKGDAHALGEAAARWASPGAGALLHVKGSDGPSALAAALARKGFAADSVVLYDMEAVAEPPRALRDVFAGGVDAALFFSPRSAAIFKDCAAGLATDATNAICISQVTAAALAPLVFRETRIAAEPNQQALLSLL
ncbi:MAG TPA: uroporphyrinogen-III synthase [Rhizomicrobium sp.]|jgi:uroporphyrinogen-III synthase|nr:uroporphyrinogen-III synthase [Rhizomicrobium sp.]